MYNYFNGFVIDLTWCCTFKRKLCATYKPAATDIKIRHLRRLRPSKSHYHHNRGGVPKKETKVETIMIESSKWAILRVVCSHRIIDQHCSPDVVSWTFKWHHCYGSLSNNYFELLKIRSTVTQLVELS